MYLKEVQKENTHSLQERWNHWSVKYVQWIIAGAKGTLWLQEHNYSKLPPRQNFSLWVGSQYFCANRRSSNVEKPYMCLRLYHRHGSHCRQHGEGNSNIGLQHESWLLHCKVKELGAASSCTWWVKMPLICINLHKFHNMNLQCYKHLIHLSKRIAKGHVSRKNCATRITLHRWVSSSICRMWQDVFAGRNIFKIWDSQV